MKVYVVGNPLVKEDSLPLTLLPKLKKALPQLDLVEIDPNENFIPEEGSIIIDTVAGINEVRWFDSLDEFTTTKSISPHDYDLGFHLQLLQKTGKLKQFRILGIPKTGNRKQLFQSVIKNMSIVHFK